MNQTDIYQFPDMKTNLICCMFTTDKGFNARFTHIKLFFTFKQKKKGINRFDEGWKV